MGVYSHVSLTIADKVVVNTHTEFTVTGSIVSVPNWPNFAVGFCYFGGPSPYIEVNAYGRVFRVEPMQCVFRTTSALREGTTLTVYGTVRFPSEGSYRVAGVSGYHVEGEGLYPEQVDMRVVEVTTPPAPPLLEQIPPWAWALIGSGVTAGVIAAVVYTTRK